MQNQQTAFFDKDFPKFLKNLEKNNNRDWFNENKPTYIKKVKEPFAKLINTLIDKAQSTIVNMQNVEAKDCIFRIYRDVRFSKNKLPYKAQVSAVIAPLGRKDYTGAGYYLEINPKNIRVYSGIYMPSTQQRNNLRNYIFNNQKKFLALINDKEFIETFGEIRGDKAKRIPKELVAAADKNPILFNKQFYFFTELDIRECLKPTFANHIHQLFLKSLPISTFLAKGIE